MGPSRIAEWRRAFERLDELLALDPDARAESLAALAVSDPALHAQVLAVLRGEELASDAGFLEPGAPLAAASATLAPGERVGPYRIERELGAGGTGTVWLARRVDGQFEGEVAVKMLHHHLTGPAFRERFRREASLLGKLSHPDIARILDAGTHEGNAFLVLEYVRGQSIDHWCDARHLAVAQRLALFIAVCEAVAHAHANLVVHRDIKPSNILVTDDGHVKLLDFGIGKLLDVQQAGSDDSNLTQVTGRVLTPDYAAPEQILNEPVNTSADVYSLGALLYVLLTGQRPFAAAGTSLARIEQSVLNEEPPTLARASRSAGDDAATARATTPAKLARTMSGDLEHIVRRAMRKQPGERYDSVYALIEDLRRLLNHEPVRARRGSRLYQVGRFLRRYRAGVITASVALLMIGAALAGAMWQARIATREARKANAVKEFLLDVFNSNSERHPDGARARQTTAEELLEIASRKILATAMGDPELQAELLGTLASLNDTLERMEEAESLLRAQIDLVTSSFGASDRRIVRPYVDLAQLMLAMQRFDEVKALGDKADAVLAAHGGRLSIEGANLEILRGQVAYLTVDDVNDTTVTRHVNAGVNILEQLPPSNENSEALVSALYMLSKAHSSTGHAEDALQAATRGLELAVRLRGADDVLVAMGHQQSSAVLVRLRRLSEAETHMNKAVEIFTHAVGADGWYTVLAYLDVGRLRLQQGRYRAAVEAFEQMHTARRRQYGDDDLWVQHAVWGLGQSLLDAGDFMRAGVMLDSVADNTAGNLRVLVLKARASLRLQTDRPAESLADADLAVSLAREANGPRSLSEAQLEVLRAEALAALHRLPDARAALTAAGGTLEGSSSIAAFPATLARRLAQASVELQAGNTAAAQIEARSVLTALDARTDRASLWLLEETAQRRLAETARLAGRLQDHCRALGAAIILREPNVLPIDPRLLEARRLQRKCLEPET